MSFYSWLRNSTAIQSPRGRAQHRTAAPRFRPQLETLEDRTLLSNYTAATVSDLIADINAANAAGGVNTITLTAPTTSPYVLTAVNNSTNGANGLPVISGGKGKAAADNLTIIGNGVTIERSTAVRTGIFRLFDVAAGGSLTLENLTLQNGYAFGTGSWAEGGALYNQGTLTLSGVTVLKNIAQGLQGGTTKKGSATAGYDAAGGGIWSSGSLTVENQTVIKANAALGGQGLLDGSGIGMTPGGRAFGGGICIAGGTANITNSNIGTYYPLADYGVGNKAEGGTGYNTSSNGGGRAYGGGVFVGAGTVTLNADYLEANTAQGGATRADVSTFATPRHGLGYGGGLYVASGSVTLTNDTIDHNLAGVPYFGEAEYGYGGGIYIASRATVYLDPFTVTNTYTNESLWPWNIDGTYTLLS